MQKMQPKTFVNGRQPLIYEYRGVPRLSPEPADVLLRRNRPACPRWRRGTAVPQALLRTQARSGGGSQVRVCRPFVLTLRRSVFVTVKGRAAVPVGL